MVVIFKVRKCLARGRPPWVKAGMGGGGGGQTADISDYRITCGLSLLLVLVLAPRGFLQVLWFSPLLKNHHFQIPIRSGECPKLVLCAKYIDT